MFELRKELSKHNELNLRVVYPNYDTIKSIINIFRI